MGEEPEKGSDIEHHMHLGFWDAIRGTQVRITANRKDTCPPATAPARQRLGNGMSQLRRDGKERAPERTMRFSGPCPDCGGTGKRAGLPEMPWRRPVSAPRRLTCAFRPASIRGRASACREKETRARRRRPGDLYIVTEVEPHPIFERKGDNIYVKVPVTISRGGARRQGGSADYRRRFTIKIPPGTQSGQKLRLRGKGAPSLRGEVARRRICGGAGGGAESRRRAHEGNSARAGASESRRPAEGSEGDSGRKIAGIMNDDL